MMVEPWERAVNFLTKELSGDERWFYPCWIQSEPAQEEAGKLLSTASTLLPKPSKPAKLEIYFCKNRMQLCAFIIFTISMHREFNKTLISSNDHMLLTARATAATS